MAQRPATFYLKVAKSLIDESRSRREAVEREHGSIAGAIKEGKEVAKEAFTGGVGGFLKGLSASAGLGAWEERLKKGTELDLALQQVDKAEKIDPSAKLDDGSTVALIRGEALFEKGEIAFSNEKWKDALKHYRESLNYNSNQVTYFNIGLSLKEAGAKDKEIAAAFEQAIDADPESELAIAAGKELARLGV